MLGRVPEGRRPRQGDPADQARHHDALRPAVRNPRVSSEALVPSRHRGEGQGEGRGREYRWRIPANWWTRSRRYFLYVVREFTALPLALWLLWLLVEIKRAGDGPARYSPHGSAAFVVFSVIVLTSALYHSFTFLTLAGPFIHLTHPLRYLLVVLGVPAAKGAPAQAVFYGGAVLVTLVTIWVLLTTVPISFG